MRRIIGRLLFLAMLAGCSLLARSRYVLCFSTPRFAGRISRRTSSLPTRSRPHETTTRLRSVLSDPPTEFVLPHHVHTWLDIHLPEGRCVGVSVSKDGFSEEAPTTEFLGSRPDHWMHAAFHPDELAYGLILSEAVASNFWLGRLAMRIALDFPTYPIMKDSCGRPQLQDQFCGSISHKEQCGIALVSNSSLVAGVGVDLELTARPGKRSIAPRVLTERERETLGTLPGVSADEEVLLRFSLKESIYKAAHPLLCQYVGFQEAEVTPYADGTASCSWLLGSKADSALANLQAHWRRLEGQDFFLTSASVESAKQ